MASTEESGVRLEPDMREVLERRILGSWTPIPTRVPSLVQSVCLTSSMSLHRRSARQHRLGGGRLAQLQPIVVT